MSSSRKWDYTHTNYINKISIVFRQIRMSLSWWLVKVWLSKCSSTSTWAHRVDLYMCWRSASAGRTVAAEWWWATVESPLRRRAGTASRSRKRATLASLAASSSREWTKTTSRIELVVLPLSTRRLLSCSSPAFVCLCRRRRWATSESPRRWGRRRRHVATRRIGPLSDYPSTAFFSIFIYFSH